VSPSPRQSAADDTQAAGVMRATKALLVLGMARHVLDPRAEEPILDASSLIEAVSGEIAYFRERRRPVVFLVPGLEGSSSSELLERVHPDLRADPLDLLLPLPSISGFQRTGLDAFLTSQRVDMLTIVGVRSHLEVLLTAADAYARGMSYVVPAPCVASTGMQEHTVALRQIRQLSRPLVLPLE